MNKCIGFVCVAWVVAGSATAEPLLPDLIMSVQESIDRNSIDSTFIPGRTLLRFESSIPNIGDGPYILETNRQPAGNGRELVDQVIEDDSGGPLTRRDAGAFEYNPANFHMECNDWVAYKVREILPGDGVGEILRSGQKSSVRITSSRGHPGYTQGARILANTTGRHGIGVGWTDIYTMSLEPQWVDITGLKKGEYWLELTVDPRDYIIESDETNNTVRFKITLADDTQPDFETHRADTGDFGSIDLGEVLRVIQLYNGNVIQCAEDTEDGYASGNQDSGCQPHSSDYAPQDWRIELSELLRLLQIYSLGAYALCGEGEDGTCL